MPSDESDKRILKEDYCNFDLIARCWNDEYRGRVWKNKDRIADFEGSDLDEIMAELHAIVDEIQRKKRQKRGRKKPAAAEIAEAILSAEPKLTRAQKMMLVLHSKTINKRLSVKAISRLGEYATAELAFADYAMVARRVCDELAYAPGSRKKDLYPGATLLFAEEIAMGSVTLESVLTLRPEIEAALEILQW